MRREFFNHKDRGYLKSRRPTVPTQNAITQPAFFKEMVKGQIANVLPMIIIGGWINFTFSGFVACKIPFPITLQFKDMLQRGIELRSLDASWVSSASWYFLNVFGLRSIYNLILSENEDVQQENTMATTPSEINILFKAEWETLEISEHKWNLLNIEKHLIK
ncbi:hypothetical protein L9F63_007312 [Diploptera punctata]|uniref:ER membrane protein complex subunit 3 n=1 Tax=Diploptera punctata TaxID=6984 RepID=A0AAD7Z867_DIPPU|nr:hypothetical protein L9F63_007312 [Diploptera punctata]